MILRNALVFNDAHVFRRGDLHMEGGHIVPLAEGPVLDCDGLYAIPGLIDMHLHGANGHDLCDATPRTLAGISEYLIRFGVTAFQPATMTLDEESLAGICAVCARHENTPDASELLGVYLEGLFIAHARRGAQNGAYIRPPDLALFRRLQKASGGRIRVVTIAPEAVGAMDFIDAVRGDVLISLAHTEADYATALSALERGASQVTHLFNAMPPFSHRAPGVVGAAFDAGCRVEIIADGNFVDPCMIRAMFRMFGEDRVILISDGMRATGLPEGRYELGGQHYTVRGDIARMEDGALAGPVITLLECFQRVVRRMGVPLEHAVQSVTVNPARQLGIDDRYGSLSAGHFADVVLLGPDLSLRHVFKRGRQIPLS